MAPRKRSRYRVIVTPRGKIVLDRATRTWSVVQGRITLGYGRMQDGGWTAFLLDRVKG